MTDSVTVGTFRNWLDRFGDDEQLKAILLIPTRDASGIDNVEADWYFDPDSEYPTINVRAEEA